MMRCGKYVGGVWVNNILAHVQILFDKQPWGRYVSEKLNKIYITAFLDRIIGKFKP